MRTPLISILVVIGMCMHLQIMSQAEGPTLTELNKHFRTFELQKTPTTNTKSSDVQNTLDLRISAKEVVTLQLQKSVVLSNNHRVSLASGDKLLRRDLIATTYEGTVSGHSGSNLRLTIKDSYVCLLYTSPSPRDATLSRMPSSA